MLIEKYHIYNSSFSCTWQNPQRQTITTNYNGIIIIPSNKIKLGIKIHDTRSGKRISVSNRRNLLRFFEIGDTKIKRSVYTIKFNGEKFYHYNCMNCGTNFFNNEGMLLKNIRQHRIRCPICLHHNIIYESKGFFATK